MLTLTALALAYALAPTRPRAPQPLAYALVSSSRPRAPPPLALAGRGFGPQAAPVPSLPTTLDADAQALLDESGGDATKARTSMMGYTLAYVAEEMPELYEKIRNDSKEEEAHAALVEITWDAIAAFLPVTHAPTPTKAAGQKLTAVARCGVGVLDGSDPPSVLDVGCGTGLLLPFLTTLGAPPQRYRGIDLSPRMVEVAQRVHALPAYEGATFEDVSFDSLASEAEPLLYDAIFFNAALQFFPDPSAALAGAARLLAPGDESRIVLSHISGASFVQKELEDNPTTVRSLMPTLEELEAIAAPLGLQVVLPSFLGADAESIATALDAFYCVVLRWDAAHGGVDGETGSTEAPEDLSGGLSGGLTG